jgi:hypothetical protein
MITYYSISPRTLEVTKTATFELRDGVVLVHYEKPEDAASHPFKQIVIDGPNGRTMGLTPADGQRFLDGLLELRRSYGRVVDE